MSHIGLYPSKNLNPYAPIKNAQVVITKIAARKAVKYFLLADSANLFIIGINRYIRKYEVIYQY